MQVKKGVGSNLGSNFRPANFTGSKFDPKLRLDLGFELSPSCSGPASFDGKRMSRWPFLLKHLILQSGERV